MRDLFILIQKAIGTRSNVNAETTPASIENWDSLNHIKMIIAIEQKYGITFDIDEITQAAEGVGRIIELLEKKGVALDRAFTGKGICR